ncbi:MAG: MFS transporter [Actinomycetota bacterium]
MSHPDPRLEARKQSRVAWLIPTAFFALGGFWGSWNASLAGVQSHFHLTNTGLGVLLAIGVSVGAITGAAASHLGRRARPVHLLALILLIWGILLLPLAGEHRLFWFALSFTAVQIVMGAVDSVMNVGATAALAGRPGALVRFHAIFNVGAMAGALGTGLLPTASNGGSLLWTWLAVCLLGATGLWALSARNTVDPRLSSSVHVGLPSPNADMDLYEESTRDGSIFEILRRDHLVGLLVIFAAAALVEGGVFTWGVLYLRTELHIGLLVGASAYALGNLVAGLGRVLGGPLIGTRTPLRALAIGSIVTGVGLLIEAHTHIEALAAAMLALTAAGVSLNWPLLMADVSARSSSPSSSVGAFTAAGYLGWVAGAPLIGVVADHWSLSAGITGIAVLAFVIAVAAAWLIRRDTIAGRRD